MKYAVILPVSHLIELKFGIDTKGIEDDDSIWERLDYYVEATKMLMKAGATDVVQNLLDGFPGLTIDAQFDLTI